MTQLSADKLLITRGTGLIEAEVDGEMVALHVDNGTCYSFNRTAYHVWRLVEQPSTLAEVCAALSTAFDVDPAICENEVRALLDDLAQDGLVTLGARKSSG